MLNPILRREAQTTLRSWKVYGVIVVYVAFIMFVTNLFITESFRSAYSGFRPESIDILYAILSGIQFGLILITVPALTSGSISGERERQTLDILLITKMTPMSIVVGKLLSCISVVLLLIVATMPVYAFLFHFGGVSIVSIFVMLAFMMIVAFTVGAVSIFFSTIVNKTVISTVLVYLFFGTLVFGTYFSYMIYTQIYLNIRGSVDVFSLSTYAYGFLSANPAAGFFSLIDLQLGTEMVSEMTMVRWSGGQLDVPIFFVNCIINIVVGVLFLKLAERKIKLR